MVGNAYDHPCGTVSKRDVAIDCGVPQGTCCAAAGRSYHGASMQALARKPAGYGTLEHKGWNVEAWKAKLNGVIKKDAAAIMPQHPYMGFSLLRILAFLVFRKMKRSKTKPHLLCGCE